MPLSPQERSRKYAATSKGKSRSRKYDASPEGKAKRAAYRAANKVKRSSVDKARAEKKTDEKKAAAAAYVKAWRAANPGKNAAALKRYRAANPEATTAHRLKKYGLTLEQFKAMAISQNHVCAICREPPVRARMAVDHCHVTGKVRGLLCEFCNWMLGNAKDRPERLRAGADYLEKASHQCP